MADFKIAYHKTGGFEGGYSNDPSDPGGETWCGIARKKNPGWIGWKTVDFFKTKPGFPTNMKDSSALRDQVTVFYKSLYWDPIYGDKLVSQEFANMFYGSAVNLGVTRAIKMYQSSSALGYNELSDEQAEEKLASIGINYGHMDEKTLNLFNASNNIA